MSVENTPRQAAMSAATAAAKQVIAQSKNPRTTLGKMRPDGVAYHAAYAAITAYEGSMERSRQRKDAAYRAQMEVARANGTCCVPGCDDPGFPYCEADDAP